MNLFNPLWPLAASSQLNLYKAISAVLLVLMILYTLIRWKVNVFGGIYCFKRLIFGCSLAFISVSGGIDSNLGLTVGLLLSS